MTKEEQIRELVRVQNTAKEELQDALLTVENLQERIALITREINWLSHLIRKGE